MDGDRPKGRSGILQLHTVCALLSVGIHLETWIIRSSKHQPLFS